MQRQHPVAKASYSVLNFLVFVLPPTIAALVGILAFLSGERPHGLMGRLFGFLWETYPVWSHLFTFVGTLLFAFVAGLLLSLVRGDSSPGIPAEAEQTLDLQDKTIRAHESHGRLLETQASSASDTLKKLAEDYAQLSVDMALARDDRDRLRITDEFSRRILGELRAALDGAANDALARLGGFYDIVLHNGLGLGLEQRKVVQAFVGGYFPGPYDPADAREWFVFHDARLGREIVDLASVVLGRMLAFWVLREIVEKNPGIGAEELLKKADSHLEMVQLLKREQQAKKDQKEWLAREGGYAPNSDAPDSEH